MTSDTLLIAKLKFLVLPLAYWKTKKIDAQKAKEIINGPSSIYHIAEDMNIKWSNLVHSVILNEQNTHITYSQNNSDDELEDMIDKLVNEHYEIQEICNANDKVSIESTLQKCINTYWSSLGSDSKADIHNLSQNY